MIYRKYKVRVDTYQGNFFMIDVIADDPHDAAKQAKIAIVNCGAGYTEEMLKIGYVFDDPKNRNIELQ